MIAAIALHLIAPGTVTVSRFESTTPERLQLVA
jgi:hypothetical protein